MEPDGEGEDEERLGRLLEGALGIVGGAQVGDGNQHCGERPPQRPEVIQGRQCGQRGEDADRDDLADEGLAEPDPRQRGNGVGQRVRSQRVAGFRRGSEAAAQPLGPGQVQAEVVVKADAEHPPASADGKGDRENEGNENGDQRPFAQRSVSAAPRLPPEDQRRDHDQSQHAERRAGRVPRRSRQQAGDRDHRTEADRRRQPDTRLAPAARARIARPTSSEAAQISAAEA